MTYVNCDYWGLGMYRCDTSVLQQVHKPWYQWFVDACVYRLLTHQRFATTVTHDLNHPSERLVINPYNAAEAWSLALPGGSSEKNQPRASDYW